MLHRRGAARCQIQEAGAGGEEEDRLGSLCDGKSLKMIRSKLVVATYEQDCLK